MCIMEFQNLKAFLSSVSFKFKVLFFLLIILYLLNEKSLKAESSF